MFKFRWLITDDIKKVSFKDFEEYGDIEGFFQMDINSRQIGWMPFSKEEEECGGGEYLVWMMEELISCLKELNKEKYYELQPLDLNLIQLNFAYKQELEVTEINRHTGETCWIETIAFDEFQNEINKNVVEFIENVKELNPILLESRHFARLMNYYKKL